MKNSLSKEELKNDLLYDTLAGIMQAPSNHYDATRDFSNPKYRFNLHNLTTLLGEQPLANDPLYMK